MSGTALDYVCNWRGSIDVDTQAVARAELAQLYQRIQELNERESFAREALQAADMFLDYSHAGTGAQSLAYRYVKELIKKWLNS